MEKPVWGSVGYGFINPLISVYLSTYVKKAAELRKKEAQHLSTCIYHFYYLMPSCISRYVRKLLYIKIRLFCI